MNFSTHFGRDAIDASLALSSAISSFFKRWLKPAPSTRPARCGNIQTLLMHLCDMDEDLCLWVLRWLAYPLRNPGAKMETSLIFNGGQGSGKGLFFNRVVASLYGDNAAKIRPRDLDSAFNYWATGANLVVVDGALSLRHLERMKAYAAAEFIVFEIKGCAPTQAVNRLNFVYLSNHEDFLPIDTSNRRIVVIEVPPARPHGFYQAIRYEIENGGIDAFRNYLLHDLDMGDFDQFTPPPMQTSAVYPDRRAA